MTHAVNWLLLITSIIFNAVGTSFVNASAGFTRIWPTIWMFVFYGLSLLCFGIALKVIQMSVAYAIWAGLGTVLIVVIGALFFKEPITLVKIIAIVLVIAGVVILKLTGGTK